MGTRRGYIDEYKKEVAVLVLCITEAFESDLKILLKQNSKHKEK